MFMTRWITGLVAVPFLAYLIVKGGIVFSVFIGIVALIALWEYFRITFNQDDRPSVTAMKIIGYLQVVLIMGAAHFVSPQFILNSLVISFLTTAFLSLLLYRRDPFVFETAKKQLTGILYIPVLLSYLVLIRDGSTPEGIAWVFFVVLVVFCGDIGALYTGTFFGRHKLYPALSPKKTIEGSLGGIAANILSGLIYKLFFMPELSWGVSLLFCVALGVAGQIGDLFESGLKRVANIKDSGVILPGHGGILDRIDAIMFAAPVAYIFKTYLF